MKLDKLSQFVVDECDKCLDKLDRRKDLRQIFIETPNKEAADDVQRNDDLGDRGLCKKFMPDPHKIRVDEARSDRFYVGF